MSHNVIFRDIPFGFAQNSWNFLKNKAHMPTMRMCPLDLGLLVTDPGPCCYALKSTATIAWRPRRATPGQRLTTIGILKASSFLGDKSPLRSTVSPGLPSSFIELSLERHSSLSAHSTFFPSLSLRVRITLWSEGSSNLPLTPFPFPLINFLHI